MQTHFVHLHFKYISNTTHDAGVILPILQARKLRSRSSEVNKEGIDKFEILIIVY
jgi:hypothetical protein